MVVVGLGGSGLTAGAGRRQRRREVLVLERAEQIGGTTAVSVVAFRALQRAHGGARRRGFAGEEALAYIRALAKESAPDDALIEAFVDSDPR